MRQRLFRTLPILVAVFIAPLLFACGGDGDQVQDTGPQRAQLRDRLSTTLTNVNERISALQAEAATLPEQDQAAYDDHTASLNEARIDLSSRMDRIDTVPEEEWETFRAETEQAINTAEQRLQQAPPPAPAA